MPRGSLAGMLGLILLAGCAGLEDTIEDIAGRDD